MRLFVQRYNLLLSRCALLFSLLTLSACCTNTIYPECDPMTKWQGYVIKGP